MNGTLTKVEETRLQVSDLAILRGFGIFDYFLVRGGQPLFLSDYLDRFFTSAEHLGISVPTDRSGLTDQIMKLLEANGQLDAGIRLVLTGGYADDSYTPVQPNLLVMQHAYKAPPDWQFERGIRLLSYNHQRELPEIKSINYLTGIRLQPTLRAAGADYLLYHDRGVIRESDRSNFFGLTENGTIVTPHEKILRGITRKQILDIAPEIAGVEERMVLMDEIPSFREAFLTSSTKGVMPVIQVDDTVIGDGRPGEMTQRLGELFREKVSAYSVI